MAFTQKIKKKFSVTKYTTGTIDYGNLFQIASAMGGDPRYLSSDPGTYVNPTAFLLIQQNLSCFIVDIYNLIYSTF